MFSNHSYLEKAYKHGKYNIIYWSCYAVPQFINYKDN